MSKLNKSGLTLLELSITMLLSALLIVGCLAYFIPALNSFAAEKTEDDLRLTVSGSMDFIESEVGSMRAVYVDANQCYARCMTDGNNNRIYYYWSGSNLFRKKESTTSAISCSGGSIFSSGLDKNLTTFSTSNVLLNATLGATGKNKEVFKLSHSMLPSLRERDVILYEGFECASLSDGWSVTSGLRTNWSITSGSHLGLYEITDTSSGNGADSTKISIPIDLSRISTAHLRFNYMNSGTIQSPDLFLVELYDGTNWQKVYNDDRGNLIPSFKQIDADLSGYKLTNTNQLRFTSSLSVSGSHWYVDGISVYVP